MSLLKSKSNWRIALHSSVFLISYKIPAVKMDFPLSLCDGLKLRFCFLKGDLFCWICMVQGNESNCSIFAVIANYCSTIPQRPENNYDEWTLLITTWKCFETYGIFKCFNLSHRMAPLHFYIYKRLLRFEYLLQPLWSWRKKKQNQQYLLSYC